MATSIQGQKRLRAKLKSKRARPKSQKSVALQTFSDEDKEAALVIGFLYGYQAGDGVYLTRDEAKLVKYILSYQQWTPNDNYYELQRIIRKLNV